MIHCPTSKSSGRPCFSSLPGMILSFDPSEETGYQTWFEGLEHKQAQVSKLIMAYRSLGHLRADVDPMGVMPRGSAEEMELQNALISVRRILIPSLTSETWPRADE